MSGAPARSDTPLQGRLIVLGITGSIAAFKAPEIVRALRAAGADVQALLTPAATRFVSPLTLRTLTGHDYLSDTVWDAERTRIFHRGWFVVGASQRLQRGNRTAVDVAGERLILTRAWVA